MQYSEKHAATQSANAGGNSIVIAQIPPQAKNLRFQQSGLVGASIDSAEVFILVLFLDFAFRIKSNVFA